MILIHIHYFSHQVCSNILPILSLYLIYISYQKASPFTPTMMAIINVGEDGEKLEPLYIAGRNVKWYTALEKNLMGPQKR